MKRIYISVLCTLYFVTLSFAQTLNVQVGNVTYHFPAAQAGSMPYENGTTLTVMGKSFTLSEVSITSMRPSFGTAQSMWCITAVRRLSP